MILKKTVSFLFRPTRSQHMNISAKMQEDISVNSHLVSDYGVGLDNLMSFYEVRMDKVEKEICEAMQKATGLPTQPHAFRASSSLSEKVGKKMISGNTVTCPGFYAPQGRTLRVPIRFPSLLDNLRDFRLQDFRFTNFEMETAAYFGLGKLLGHETASVNAVIANRVTKEFSKNPAKVIDSLIKKVLEEL